MFEQLLIDIASDNEVRNALITIKEQIKNSDNIQKLKSQKGYNKELWIELLKSEDAKIRKNTALIMGNLNEEGFVDVLYKSYVEEHTLFVKPAYLEAISKCQYTIYSEGLKSRLQELSTGNFSMEEVKHVAKEIKLLRKMFPESDKHKRHVFVGSDKPVRIVLTARRDLIPVVYDKVTALEGFKDIKSIFCGVAATITDFEIVKKLRVYKELLIPLNGMKPTNKSDILEALMKGNLMELLVTLHKKSDEPFYFRLTAKDLDVATLGSKLEAMSGGRLINSTSDYEIEIKLISGAEGRVIAFLKLHTLNDYRFNYRIHHVAASIHPSEASVIAELSKDYLTKNAVVLDSFAGVGTMLIERNRLVKAKFMYAIDTFGKAVDGGRANAKAARADINYINKDYFDFSHEHLFDEIITNFPRFREREEADAFYGRFFAKTGEILKESGVVIMCSDEKNLVKKYLRLNENYKLLREFTFNEKEGQYVFIIKKTLTNT